MKIAIHNRPGSFSDRWIQYCKEKNIAYKLVNCYDNDAISQLSDCNALMWHHHHENYKDVLFSKQLLFSLQQSGIKVFPDFNTAWHFDDKVGQKYLLECLGVSMVPSYVFYDKKEALDWVNSTAFPKVFKLRGGAGSRNVKLVRNKHKAITLISKAFGNGFSQFDKWGNLKERIRLVKEGKDSLMGIFKGIVRLFVPTEYNKMHFKEKGYVYFQDFVPNNFFDIRVIVVGEKAIAIKRLVRKNDFKASGSGEIIFDNNEIDIRCIQISFDVNQKLMSQSIAYDFVFDNLNNPLIIELSYGFSVTAYDSCPGYWDKDLNWHQCKVNPQFWMIENLVSSLGK